VVLVFVRYYLPGYRAGGPIRTIANMIDRLGDSFEFKVVTSDRDLGDSKAYPGVETGKWMQQGPALVRYFPPGKMTLKTVAEIIQSTPHDVIYLNSFFDPRFTQQVLVNRKLGRLSARPMVLAPRGEFSEGALALERRKKQIFMKFAKLLRLYENLTWQVSSEFEAADLLRVLPIGVGSELGGALVVSGHVTVAPDLPATGNVALGSRVIEPRIGPLRVCFISRISPKKNLDYALEVLAKVDVPIRFTVYGPVEDPIYWAKCRELIGMLPSNVTVVVEKQIHNSCVIAALEQHDLFFFPTRGENFGHVIHEALRAGLPLLISDQTPWRDLKAKGVGWELPLDDVSAFATHIKMVAGWSSDELNRTAIRARALANQVANDPSVVEANRNLFLNAIQLHVQDQQQWAKREAK